ncbi:hypothetical protein Cgig2_030962 [Carnegiea gigantea]|uniref:Uncharacterized protein n=1 Tax=Carnegiea gigantea TaxID=171969 RepID=A0A9Q1K4V0_9CARY|nr:hypothetical protein Cgig2_030962 [Carnegiea gigantea]
MGSMLALASDVPTSAMLEVAWVTLLCAGLYRIKCHAYDHLVLSRCNNYKSQSTGLTFYYVDLLITLLFVDAHKYGPTRCLSSLGEKEQNSNLKPFATITPNVQYMIGKNTGPFICECSKWVRESYPLKAKNKFLVLHDSIEGIDVAPAIELQYMLFRGWQYQVQNLHFTR